MKARQFCSVCKQWLDMEVVPTGDGDEDDGVIWFRCPQCQGFLPKLGGGDPARPAADESEETQDAPASDDGGEDDLPWDSPAAMMAARTAGEATDDVLEARRPVRSRRPAAEDREDSGADDDEDDDGEEDAADTEDGGTGGDAEPVAQYAAMLAAADPATAAPYRPSASFTVGQCIHHLAWEDCGVVVAKESLPGGRRAIKCYFGSAGVVRLIEEAPE